MNTLECPLCHAKLKVKESLAGKTVACPKCKGAITIPHPKSTTNNEEPLADVDPFSLDGFESPAAPGANFDFGFGSAENSPSTSPVTNSYPPYSLQTFPSSPTPAPATSHRTTQAPPHTKPQATGSVAPQGMASRWMHNGRELLRNSIELSALALVFSGYILLLVCVLLWQSIGLRLDDTSAQSVAENADTNSAPTPEITWPKLHENAKSSMKRLYAYQTNDRNARGWTLAQKALRNDGPIESIENEGLSKSEPIFLPSHASNVRPEANPSVAVPTCPELAIKEYQDKELRIVTLTPFGLHVVPEGNGSMVHKNCVFWSAEGDFVFVLESNPKRYPPSETRLLKINSKSWVIEKIAYISATSMTMTSEGLVMALTTTGQNPQDAPKQGRMFSESEKTLFPLLAPSEANCLLALIDLENLQTKKFFAVPDIMHVAGTSDSPKVLAAHTDGHLFELNVKNGELTGCQNLDVTTEGLQLSGDRRNVFVSADLSESNNPVSRVKVTGFRLNNSNFERIGEMETTGGWLNSSSNGRYFTAAQSGSQVLFNNNILRRPRWGVWEQGMSFLDNQSQAFITLNAGAFDNEVLNVYFRHPQKIRTFVLSSNFLPPFRDKAANTRVDYLSEYRFTQANEPLEKPGIIDTWNIRSFPFAITPAPDDRGFLALSAKGAYFIQTVEESIELQPDNSEASLTLLKQATMVPVANPLAPPKPSPSQLLLKVEPTEKGTLLSLPYSFSPPECIVTHPENGDLYILAKAHGKNARTPRTTWIIRVDNASWSQKKEVPASAAVQLPHSMRPSQLLFKRIQDQNVLIAHQEHVIWLLDSQSLMPKFDLEIKNPIDINTNEVIKQLRLLPDRAIPSNDQEAWGFSVISNSHLDNDSTVTLSGLSKDLSRNTSVTLNLKSGSLNYPADISTLGNITPFGPKNPLGIADPYSVFAVEDTSIMSKTDSFALESYPMAFAKKQPWIATRGNGSIMLINRSDVNEKIAVTLPTICEASAENARTVAFDDSDYDRLIVATSPSPELGSEKGGLIWILNYNEFPAPKTPVLASRARFPSYLIPDQTYKIPLNLASDDVSVNILDAPNGLSIVDEHIVWTPGKADLGHRDLDIEISFHDKKIIERHNVLVGHEMTDLGIRLSHLVWSPNFRYFFGYSQAQNMLVVVEPDQKNIIFSRTFEKNVPYFTIDNHSAFLADIMQNKITEIPLTSPQQEIVRELKKPSQQDNQSRFRHFQSIGERYLLLNGTLYESQSIEVSPLQKFASRRSGKVDGGRLGSGEFVFGEITIDQQGRLASFLGLNWANCFNLNGIGGSLFEQLTPMTNPAEWEKMNDGSQRHPLTPNVVFTKRYPAAPDSTEQIVEIDVTTNDGAPYMEFYTELPKVGPDGTVYFIPNSDNHEAVNVTFPGGKLFVQSFSKFCIAPVENPEAKTLLELQKWAFIHPNEPLTVASTDEKTRILFPRPSTSLSYEFEETSPIPLTSLNFGSFTNNEIQELLKWTMEDDGIVCEIDTVTLTQKLLGDSNFKNQFRSFLETANSSHQPLNSISEYRDRVGKQLQEVTQKPIEGIPVWLLLQKRIRFSNGAAATLYQVVIFDLPKEKFPELLR